MTDERPTVAQVAARAGVSVASVSRVLNGLPASAEMRQRVNDAVAEMGYRPNAFARSLKVRRSDQLAFAVADVGNPVYVEMMRAIEDETRARGYRLLVSSTGGRTEDMLALLDSLGHGYADGLVLSPVRVDDALVDALRQVARPPWSSSARCRPTCPSTTSAPTPPAVSGMALEHLHAQGCRADRLRQRSQRHGARLGSAGAPSSAPLGLSGSTPTSRCASRPATSPWPRGGRRRSPCSTARVPDAVLGGNDLLAIATMQVLAEHGLRSRTTSPWSAWTTPSWRGCHHPGADQRRPRCPRAWPAAARLLLDRLEEPDRERPAASPSSRA